MKHLQLIGLIVCAAFVASCETTETAGNQNGMGLQESKRLAALQERRQQEAQMDESHKNLWNAQQDILNRDGDPIGRY